MSSWTDEQLEQLSNPDNHKISYDGWEWVWYHNIDGKWTQHAVQLFTDYSKPYEWMSYHLAVWSKELNHRRLRKARYNQRRESKIQRVRRDYKKDTIARAKEIAQLNPELTHQEISNLLNVSRQSISRYLK